MEIEEYLIEDATEIIAEGDDAWREKITELGLEGQLKLLSNNGKRIPFRELSREEAAIYEELFDTKRVIEDFSYEPLPMRVLALIALCKQENYFADMQVWYNPQIKDPVLVGFAIDPNSSWGGRISYIIARWGEELLSLPELRVRATEKYIARKRAEYTRKIAEFQAALERIDLDAQSKFHGNHISEPY